MGCCVAQNDNQIVPVKCPPRKGIIRNKKERIDEMRPTFYQEKHLENVQKALCELNDEDREVLGKTISEHFLFYRLPMNERNKLINCFEVYECKKNEVIFKKHDQANMFFIIKSGSVEINTAEEEYLESRKLTVTKGGYFGDLALLYAAPRSATVTSLTDCYFYCISNQIFRKTVRETIKKNYDLAKNFIQKTAIFSYLSQKEKNALAYNTFLLRFDKGQTIFRQGDDANSFYIITKGKVELSVSGKKPLQMCTGESFGENSFQQNQFRSGTACALQESILLSIGRESLKQCLGNHLRQISFINILKWSFNRNQLLKQASTVQKQTLISEAEIREYKNKEVICAEGQKAEFIVIVLEDKVNSEETGTIFNMEYLNSENENDMKMTTKLVKDGRGCLATIKFEAIRKILGKNLDSMAKTIPELDVVSRRIDYINKISLAEIFVVRKIGEGRASKIFCVVDKFKRVYALKILGKKAMIQRKMVKAVRNQRFLMSQCDNPFLIKLYRTFKDEHFFYLLTNFIDGADLFDVLKQMGPCNRAKSRLFMGCLVSALEHLHQKSIVHRDLKPENILIDEMGYLNVVDFGVSKVLYEQNGFRTFTVTGTPHFMAPEIINVQGYSFSVDYWSLGIILYEIVCGVLPFGSQTEDPYQILREIDAKDLQFPSNYDDEAGKQLMIRLLLKNPFQRTCGQFRSIKKMAFFEDLNWEDLAKRQIKTQFKIKASPYKEQINQPLMKLIKRQKAYLGKAPSLTYLDKQF